MKPSIAPGRLLSCACLALALGGCGNKSDLVRPGTTPDSRETPAVPDVVPPADGRPATDPA
jgi:hypothetical protein